MICQKAGSSKKIINEDVSLVLDLIRGASAQLVVVGHLLSFLKIHPNSKTIHPFYIQNIGVLAFFILSGFLISFSLFNKLQNQEYSFKEYFIERFSRIYTGLIPSLVLIFFIDLIIVIIDSGNYSYWEAFNLRTFIGNLLMLQDFPIINFVTSFGTGRVLWTLAIEWWMYMFFGFFLLFRRIPINIFIKSFILLFLSIVPFFNLIGGRGNGLTIVWFLGVAITIVLTKYQLKTSNRNNFGLSFLFLVLAVSWFCYFQFDAYDLVFSSLLSASFFFLLNGLRGESFAHKSGISLIIKGQANYSFTLYLIHYSLIELMLILFRHENTWVIFLLAFIGCNLIAYWVARMTEYNHKSVSNWMKYKFS